MLAPLAMPRDVLVVWTEGDWRCELHTSEIPGEGRLLVSRGGTVVTAESVPMGTAAHTRRGRCVAICADQSSISMGERFLERPQMFTVLTTVVGCELNIKGDARVP